ncbi:MAG: alpha/beta hydrolase [Myxococcales bacterium]|nr:alpha/beta hydrolase [Myxococcales bacterium]
MLTSRTRAWRDGGRLVEIGGHRIFLREKDGGGPPLIFLHGYPSSSYDWSRVLELLPGRAVCFDFLGFGLSDKPRDQVYSLHAQADLAVEIARRFVGEELFLVAHDMGTSVATELLARDLEGRLGLRLRGVLLLNGSMILERANLTISQKLLRGRLGPLVALVSNRFIFRAQFARIFSPQHPLTREECDDQWSLLEWNRGHRILDRLTVYLHERVRFAPRWHGALRDWKGALELAWGMRDPVATPAVLAGVLELRPRAKVTKFDELGHYPQVEDPAAIATVVTRLRRPEG